jgi:hypothetical protein
MRPFARIFAILLAALLSVSSAGRAASVDLLLALVTDVSRSVDDQEFQLQKQGTLTAFTNPQVIAAIRGGTLGTIAVAYVEFASAHEVKTVVDWTLISDAAGARAFAEQITAAPRSFWGRTAISTGIDHAARMIAGSGHEATRLVIDVCGDGTNNAGRDITAARDDALRAGITINGLTIINDNPVAWNFAHVQPPGGLTKYYEENVTGGIGSFVLEIHDYKTFGEAMTRKLISEIASLPEAALRKLARK